MTDEELAATEAQRHACEVRYVATLPSHRERREYLAGVARKRSEAEAARLRKDAWALLSGSRRAA